MKNIKLIIAALASFAALSCEKVETTTTNPETNPEDGLVTLTISTGESTKTHISNVTDANGVTEIHWDEGDRLKVFSNYVITDALGDEADEFEYSMPQNYKPEGKRAKFYGKIRYNTTRIWAVYPYEAATGATYKGNLSVAIPVTQTPNPGSFQNKCNISVAAANITKNSSLNATGSYDLTEEALVTFNNVCSLLKFNVPSGINNIKSVTILTDRDIAGEMSIDYSGTIPAFGGIANGSKSISMTAAGTFADGRDYYFVLAPVAISELSIFVNTTDNKQYAATRTFSTPLQLNAGEYKSLGNLNLTNMPSFGVDFDIQDDNGYLNGTDVIFTFPNDNVSNLKLTVSKDGTIVRNIDVSQPKLNDSNKYVSSCLNETVEGWPYLPKGTYTVSGTYDTEGGAASVNNITFEINTDPNFTVGSFDASTTYNKYVNEGASVANTYTSDGNTIWVTADDVAISDKILKNANYKDMLQVQFATSPNGNNYSANLADGLDVTLSNQKVGKYTSPSYVFDGKKLTFSAKTCYVTGLPHKAAPPKNSGNQAWSDNMSAGGFSAGLGVSWGGSSISITPDVQSLGLAPSIFSPEFYSPGNLPVNIYVLSDLETKYKKKGYTALSPAYEYVAKVVCSVGDSILGEKSGKTGLTDGDRHNPKTHTEGDVVINNAFSLTAGTSQIKIYNNGSASISQYPKVYVKNVELVYR